MYAEQSTKITDTKFEVSTGIFSRSREERVPNFRRGSRDHYHAAFRVFFLAGPIASCNCNKTLSCCSETARCFVSLSISLSHSRSLEVIRNDTLEYGVYKSLLVFHCNYVCISYRFWDTERQIMAWPWNLGFRSLRVIENGTIRKLAYGFLFAFYSMYSCILYHFWNKATYCRSKIAIFHTPPAFSAAVSGGFRRTNATPFGLEKWNGVAIRRWTILICLAISIEYRRVTNRQTSCDMRYA